ncbi:PCI-domain-containing protein [Cantharellus anzutake]|uniref:PCI-domain-containing protein n=1 Tax=Cantharellus anzutake TaxID=1750568 RepID=UPI001906C22D|nr:PCI-domain-containing protein [Cantharellus anzutake]KAF8330428.1 PCI-domain-containing protein [Cantharellus anzutake]
MAETKKQEKDYSKEADVIIPQAKSLAGAGKKNDAIDKLLVIEKQSRNAADPATTTRVLSAIINILYASKDYEGLNNQIATLSKKHGQLKEPIKAMVEEAAGWLDHLKTEAGEDRWLDLLQTLQSVTEGKVHLETPRARLTLILSKWHENLFHTDTTYTPKPTTAISSPSPISPRDSLIAASDLLSELQVETYSSMERREKTEFILEQMRLLVTAVASLDGDAEWLKVRVGGRKVPEIFLTEEGNEELKFKYYDLMIQHALHSSSYLDAAKYYYKLWETPSVKADEQEKGKATLENIICFIVLAEHSNEQSDMLHRLYINPALAKLDLHYNLAKCFVTRELMRWPGIETIYGPSLRVTPIFGTSSEGDKRWNDLHSRVIEHNIRVIAQYYTRIRLPRLTALLDLTPRETEETLSRLVVSGSVYAQIDRPAGIVSFRGRKSAEDVMNEWSNDVQKLMTLVEKSWMGMNAALASRAK